MTRNPVIALLKSIALVNHFDRSVLGPLALPGLALNVTLKLAPLHCYTLCKTKFLSLPEHLECLSRIQES